ncbi:MAG: pyrimidine/purine nucleoside phosphorylase [Candidatus Thiodiazotropha sp.]
MKTFENVTVTKAANIYFEGAVTSRSLQFANGESKTLGIMQPGEYRFNTGKAEIMEILSGDVRVRLKDSEEWQDYAAGDRFEVPADSAFDIQVNKVTDYCCSFID